ncbi:MAG: leucyl aminopeptidase family protein, partial [Geminicoccaceae bacterium]
MLSCFAEGTAPARSVLAVPASGYGDWLASAPAPARAWLEATGFKARAGATALLPGADGALDGALLILSEPAEPWDVAGLVAVLPAGSWRLADGPGQIPAGLAALGWALGCYRFERYRQPEGPRPKLALPEGTDVARALVVAEASWLARDLVNTPANDLGPEELAAAVQAV